MATSLLRSVNPAVYSTQTQRLTCPPVSKIETAGCSLEPDTFIPSRPKACGRTRSSLVKKSLPLGGLAAGALIGFMALGPVGALIGALLGLLAAKLGTQIFEAFSGTAQRAQEIPAKTVQFQFNHDAEAFEQAQHYPPSEIPDLESQDRERKRAWALDI